MTTGSNTPCTCTCVYTMHESCIDCNTGNLWALDSDSASPKSASYLNQCTVQSSQAQNLVTKLSSGYVLTLCCWAIWIVVICWATTESTSMSILLNSSKQAQAPELAKPLKNFPMAMKSSWSEQLNTTHWMAIALARSCCVWERKMELHAGNKRNRSWQAGLMYNAHAYVDIYKHNFPTHTPVDQLQHKRMNAHRHARTQARPHTHTHTHTHLHTTHVHTLAHNTCAHTCTLTHTHTHLHSFCLASPSWTGWSSSKLQVESSSECEVTPVSEGGDDQSTGVTQVLIAIGKLSIHCSHQQLIVPVVPECVCV